jgi:glycosyltransferase involved in cell wall biosynthesis
VELARDARSCLVSSERARAVLEVDAGPAELLPPVHVLPLAVPDRDQGGPRGTTSPPLVVSLGRQDLDAKQPETVLEAMAFVVRSRPARLAIVGAIRPELRAELAGRAEQLGIGSVVEIAGYLDDNEYQQRLEAAACAVQLRRFSAEGEGSAAGNDALAVGLPVVTNIQSYSELSPGTVQLLPPKPTPRQLAIEILRLLDDDEHRRRLREGERAYARTWSFESLTERLLEIIDDTRAARWRRQPQTA